MPEIERESHSFLGASSSHRWMHCPGSVRLYEQLGERHESEYAATGTAAHSICEACLLDPKKEPEMFLGSILDTKEFHIPVTEQMVEATRVYVDFVREQYALFGGKLMVEQSFDLSWVHGGMYGRNDACIYPVGKLAGTLRIYDYKNGRKQVDAANNPQLLYYALGALGKDNPWFVEQVEMSIIQPNGIGKKAIDTWSISVDELYHWAENVLKPAALATEAPDAPCFTGDWCTFCEASAYCPAKRDAALNLLKPATPSHPVATLPSIATLTPQEIGLYSAFFTSEEFSAWVKALAAEELACLARGVVIPGRRLVEKTTLSNRKWCDEASVIREFGDEFGEEIYNSKLKSPAQLTATLTKLGVSKAEAKERVDALTVRDEIKSTSVISDNGTDECPFVETTKLFD